MIAWTTQVSDDVWGQYISRGHEGACKKLKLKTVPVIIADDLTEEQVRAFRLADNKVAEIAQWDIELLLSEIESVDNLDMTLFGFTDSDYTLDDFEDEETDTDFSEDEIESEGDSVSSVEYGDIYQLGRHRSILARRIFSGRPTLEARRSVLYMARR